MSEKSKNVEMKGKQEKLSYEQLEQIAGNLNNRCNQLYQQVQEAQAIIADFNEIGMLLSIIDRGEHFDEAFISRCASKIQETVSKAMDAAEERDKKEAKEN